MTTVSVDPDMPRFHVWFRAVALGDRRGMDHEGWILDLSSNGCRVEADADCVPEKSVLLELRIFTPDLDWPIMVDGAVVQKVEGNTFRLHFLRLSSKEAERLASVMERIARDAELERTTSLR